MTREQLEKLAGRKAALRGDTPVLFWADNDVKIDCPFDNKQWCNTDCPHCAIEQRKILTQEGGLVSTGQFFASLSCGGEPRSIEIEVDEKG